MIFLLATLKKSFIMPNQLNIKIFNAINRFAGKTVFLDKFGIIMAKYSPIVFIFALLYYWFKDKEYKNISLYSGYSAVLGISLNFLITLFYFHPRPFMEHIGVLLINHKPETSFPSDHTTFMLSIGFMFLYFKKTRNLGIVLSVLGLAGGTARIYSGLHYPFDILGSVLVAIISSYIIFLSRKKLQKLNILIIDLYYKVSKFKYEK